MCRKPTTAEFHPFCSRHCTDIDLGRWLGGRYAVPGEPIGRASGEEAVSQEDEDAGC
ncbi:MAG: DNA gyrase inhibitor YacG [Methyloceanibacter sp.]